MALSLSGLASGIDVDSLVTALTSVAQQPLTALKTQKSAVDTAQTTVSALSSRLSSLKSAALALSTSTGFASYTASSSDGAVVASATGSASVGSYSVSVSQLAKPQKTRSDMIASSSTTALNQSFTLNLSDSTGQKTITVGNSDTLSDIASKISASGARVSASVVNDGSGYRLALQGLDTGSTSGFTLTGAPASWNLTDYQPAQDAKLKVDGLDVTSKTNSVNNVIPGVKLALTKETTTDATVTVANDPSQLTTKVGAFMAAFNTFISAAHSATGFGSTKAQNSVLQADTAIRGAVHKVSGIIGAVVPGTSGAYQTLGSIGIKSNADGTITIDNDKLTTALNADPTSVSRLFVKDPVTGSTGMMQTMMDAVDSLTKSTSSPITARASALGAQSKQLDESATKMQTRIDAYTAQLKSKFSAMDSAVAKYQTQLTQAQNIKPVT